jgi:hypothetical protein
MRHNSTSYTDARDGLVKHWRRYMCEKRLHGKDAPPSCGGVSIRAEPVEEWVQEALIEAVENRAASQRSSQRERAKTDKELAAASAVLADITPRFKELARLYARSEIGKGEWMEARDELETRRAEAERLVAAHDGNDPLAKYGPREALRTEWPRMTTDQRRGLIAHAMPTLVVLPSGPGVRFSDSRLAPEWAI